MQALSVCVDANKHHHIQNDGLRFKCLTPAQWLIAEPLIQGRTRWYFRRPFALYAYLFSQTYVLIMTSVITFVPWFIFRKMFYKAGIHSVTQEHTFCKIYQKLSVKNNFTYYMIYPPLYLQRLRSVTTLIHAPCCENWSWGLTKASAVLLRHLILPWQPHFGIQVRPNFSFFDIYFFRSFYFSWEHAHTRVLFFKFSYQLRLIFISF